MKINLSNPLLIFVTIWIFTFFLFSLNMTTNIVSINSSILILFCGNVLSSVLIYIFVGSVYVKRKRSYLINIYVKNSERYTKFTKVLISFWILGCGFDIIYSKGVPILWIVLGVNKDYSDFGIPSFHGVVNACYLFAITLLGLRYVVMRERRVLFAILVLAFWPVMILGRGILLSALIQIVAVYLIFNRINLKSAIGFLILLLLIIYVFGWLGDLRGTANPFAYLIRQDYKSVFEDLPTGFLWFYIYVTTGLNNVAANIENISPGYTIHYSVINLLPSFIRTSLDNYQLNASLFKLVDQNLNTSTFYSGYISDFGLAGGLIGGIVLQVSAAITYFKARSGSVSALLAYTVLFECLVFSPFYDLLFLLPYLAQIGLAVVLAMTLRGSQDRQYATVVQVNR